ncbi:hypothetical protein EYF80_035758 [Liparis tanakae]|uniref:Uncharacterized protein n=1 Tax=Liparis tanakae TaxID=230148 RepID=A0A4Z2GL89_9TELE|nr:hypothetical protein EYF80_035758 [Liparis tanakae]
MRNRVIRPPSSPDCLLFPAWNSLPFTDCSPIAVSQTNNFPFCSHKALQNPAPQDPSALHSGWSPGLNRVVGMCGSCLQFGLGYWLVAGKKTVAAEDAQSQIIQCSVCGVTQPRFGITLPPKKLGSSSKALFHVLATSEDPNGFMQQRPLSSPVLLVSEDNCMIAIGKTPVTTFPMDRLNEGLLYVCRQRYFKIQFMSRI